MTLWLCPLGHDLYYTGLSSSQVDSLINWLMALVVGVDEPTGQVHTWELCRLAWLPPFLKTIATGNEAASETGDSVSRLKVPLTCGSICLTTTCLCNQFLIEKKEQFPSRMSRHDMILQIMWYIFFILSVRDAPWVMPRIEKYTVTILSSTRTGQNEEWPKASVF